MSIFTKQALIESFPAYNIFEREVSSKGYVEITANDILGVKHPRGFYRTYQAGSVMSYALQYNECPIEAVEDAKARGHQIRWINARGSMITSHARDAETVVAVHIGMLVRFEGMVATIQADHNNNLKFAAV